MTTQTIAAPTAVPETLLLRRVFEFDRLLAASTAALLVVGSVFIGNVLDWPTLVVAIIGAALVPYAWILHMIVQKGDLGSAPAKLTAGADFAWVIVSVALLIGWPDNTSTAGKWIVGAIALAIGQIGLTKIIGMHKAQSPL